MKKLIFIFAFVVLSSGFVQVDPKMDTVAKTKAIYFYSFAKYIEWPEKYKTGKFVIGVVGSSPSLVSKLNDLAATKKSGSNQDFEVKIMTSLDEAKKSNIHILYVSPDANYQLSDVLGKIKGKSTLLVTEKPGLAKQGAPINFTVVDSKQKFELNKSALDKYDLKVNSQLTAVAITVDN